MHTPTLPPPGPPAPATLRLRDGQFRRHAGLQGLVTDAEIAAATGLDRSTVNRLLRRELAPGHRIIAAILLAFPDRRFDDFFEIAPGTVSAAA
jgi:transcriptional regulator with XRE-family HTH domain